MVLGIGIDLTEVGRIEEALARHGARFLARVYTEGERSYCMERRNPAPSLAARFAAKEAASKALGTGMRQGVSWLQMEVTRPPGEAPTMQLWGAAAARAEAMGVHRIHLSLTHTGDHAQAMVLLEG
jgi:holo-[acyl-carrier protein] synthase